MMRASTFLWILVCLLPLGAVCGHVVPGGDVPKWKFSGIFGHLIDQRCSGDIRCIERYVRVATP
ncbi:ubiquinol-cytochrome c reductase, cytochrome c1 domain protein [Anaplasma phagocytophilum str. ApNP]|uniref:Ubiquinol-cytochrome c reductase, cytochrome c1 domain protein n=1 Tax=Anaplasma phagocytophilum str. ApNP TaxID=1359153 RepID=A0A0F3NIR1_ANAPH|nr:ubiquinol-cytochrome c reductase, cytochrome c1 domain protein [Anaplasma phagocytophilum str. ApNP]